MFTIVAENLISLCALMALGFIAGKIGVIDEKSSKGLGNVLLCIAMPCMIIMSMQRAFSTELLRDGLLTLGISVIIYIIAFGAGLLICRLIKIDGHKARIWVFTVIFGNVGYMGFPVMNAVFGDDILFYVSMANVVFNVLSTTLGIAVMNGFCLEKRTGAKTRNPLTLPQVLLPSVTALGFILFVTSVTIPPPLARALTMSGNMVTPLSMVIIGGILARSNLLKIFMGWKDYIYLAVKLFILPCLVLLVCKPIIGDGHVLSTVVLLTAMPAAAVTVIYAARFTDEEVYASKIIALSTLVSLITLPLIAFLMEIY